MHRGGCKHRPRAQSSKSARLKSPTMSSSPSSSSLLGRLGDTSEQVRIVWAVLKTIACSLVWNSFQWRASTGTVCPRSAHYAWPCAGWQTRMDGWGRMEARMGGNHGKQTRARQTYLLNTVLPGVDFFSACGFWLLPAFFLAGRSSSSSRSDSSS